MHYTRSSSQHLAPTPHTLFCPATSNDYTLDTKQTAILVIRMRDTLKQQRVAAGLVFWEKDKQISL